MSTDWTFRRQDTPRVDLERPADLVERLAGRESLAQLRAVGLHREQCGTNQSLPGLDLLWTGLWAERPR
jgi:hypothetical protein